MKWRVFVCLCGFGGDRRHWTCEQRRRDPSCGKPQTMKGCNVMHRKRSAAAVHATQLNEGLAR